jgi:hypothetical protein
MSTTQAVNLSPNAIKILGYVSKGLNTREAIAKRMKTSVPVVNGSLTVLKRQEMVTVDEEGVITAVEGAAVVAESAHTPRSQSKMAQARKLYAKYQHKGRQVVLDKLIGIGLTPKGASTYYQTLKTRADAEAAAPAAPVARSRKSQAAATHA